MECWVQHYSELYSRENVITEEALNTIKCLPLLEELDSDATLEELNQGLDSLASGKLPSKESIPAEVLKCYKGNTSLSCTKSFVSAREKVRYIGREGCKHRHTVQEQRRKKQLK